MLESGLGAKQQNLANELTDPLWKQYGRQLHRYLAQCLRNHDSQNTRDLAQEVYLRLLRVEKGEPINNYPAYLYRIASHVVYEFKMRARNEIVSYNSETIDEWNISGQQGLDDPVADQEGTRRQVGRALDLLHPIGRKVLLLQKLEGLEYTEIANRLGISVNMVHKHLKRSLATMRAMKWDL